MQQKSKVQWAGSLSHMTHMKVHEKEWNKQHIVHNQDHAHGILFSLYSIQNKLFVLIRFTLDNQKMKISFKFHIFITHNYTFFCFNKCFNIRSNIGKGIVSLSSKVATITVCIAASTEEECLSLSINKQEMNKNILYIEKDFS